MTAHLLNEQQPLSGGREIDGVEGLGEAEVPSIGKYEKGFALQGRVAMLLCRIAGRFSVRRAVGLIFLVQKCSNSIVFYG